MYFYLEARIDPQTYFSSMGYSGSHHKSILALKNKEVDAVAVSDDILKRGEDLKMQSIQVEDFHVMWKSELIPNSMFAYRADLSDKLKQALKAAMLSFRDNSTFGYNGLVAAKDEDYNFIRKMYDYEKRMAARRRQ
jgi:phosphonate transport system substrate-binding protein